MQRLTSVEWCNLAVVGLPEKVTLVLGPLWGSSVLLVWVVCVHDCCLIYGYDGEGA